MDVFDFKNYGPHTPCFSFEGYNTYARVVGMYDGDTITVTFPLPLTNPPCVYKFHIRLDGIDTPEIRGGGQAAVVSRDRLFNLITDIPPLPNMTKKDIQTMLTDNVYLVWLECHKFDKYGRILADIYRSRDHDKSFSQILMTEGLAKEYHGGKKA